MVEVGVVTAHPIKVIFLHSLTVFRTWRFANKIGVPCNKWYGVYEQGKQTPIALMSCLPTAKHYAEELVTAENEFRKHNQSSA